MNKTNKNLENIEYTLNTLKNTLNNEEDELKKKRFKKEIEELEITKTEYILKKSNEDEEIVKDVIKTIKKQIYSKKIKEGLLKTGIKLIDEEIELSKKNRRGPYKKRDIKEIKYYFITINPKECEIKDLQEIIKKLSNKIWMIDKIYAYVFEQRGETNKEIGKGKHIHMIIEKIKRQSIVEREMYNTLKMYCENKKLIKIEEIDEDGKKRVLNYVRGNKSQEKMKAMKITIKWRTENNLEQIYELIKEDEEFENTISKIIIENGKQFLITKFQNGKEIKALIR